MQVLLGRRARESEQRTVLASDLLGEGAVERLGVGGLARLEKLKDARAKSDRDAHDDALGDAANRVLVHIVDDGSCSVSVSCA